MDNLIYQFCSECKICTKNKSRRSRQIGLLSKLDPTTEPYEIMSVDKIGDFANNRSSKRYLHIFVDHFQDTSLFQHQ